MLNRICLQGRLAREPEIKITASGVKICSLAVACQRDFKRADGSYETDFIDCVAWRGTAEFISGHFHKGDMIILDGRLQVENYENAKGEKRTRYTVSVDSVNFGGGSVSTAQQSTEPAQTVEESTASDDQVLPFEIGGDDQGVPFEI